MAILVAVQEKELFDKVVLSGVGVELRSSGTVTVRCFNLSVHFPFF